MNTTKAFTFRPKSQQTGDGTSQHINDLGPSNYDIEIWENMVLGDSRIIPTELGIAPLPDLLKFQKCFLSQYTSFKLAGSSRESPHLAGIPGYRLDRGLPQTLIELESFNGRSKGGVLFAENAILAVENPVSSQFSIVAASSDLDEKITERYEVLGGGNWVEIAREDQAHPVTYFAIVHKLRSFV